MMAAHFECGNHRHNSLCVAALICSDGGGGAGGRSDEHDYHSLVHVLRKHVCRSCSLLFDKFC